MNKILIANGYVIATANTPFGADENADAIEQTLRRQPTAPDGYIYKLRADTLEWELVELPPVEEPELTADEVLDIILGGGEA